MKGDMVGPEVFFDLLQSLYASGGRYFLEGGQAVNVWARYFRALHQDSLGLDPFDPFASKDCDIWVDYETFKFFETEPGQLRKSQSPADGQVAIYTLPGKDALTVDLMTSVYGIPMHELDRALKRVQVVNQIAVLDPLYLFKAKCHNLVNLPQFERQDDKHVGMLTLILPAYFETLLQEVEAGNVEDRHVINELKFLRDLCKKDQCIKQTLDAAGTGIIDLFPVERFENSTSKKIGRFVTSPWL